MKIIMSVVQNRASVGHADIITEEELVATSTLYHHNFGGWKSTIMCT